VWGEEIRCAFEEQCSQVDLGGEANAGTSVFCAGVPGSGAERRERRAKRFACRAGNMVDTYPRRIPKYDVKATDIGDVWKMCCKGKGESCAAS
jgi:hypothetical protein